MMFHVGQLVVSLVDSQTIKGERYIGERLRKGHVYTVRGIIPDFPFGDGTQLGLVFEEFVRVYKPLFPDCPVGAIWFRPVSKNHIEIIEKLKLPLNEDVDA
jgi:hypothetical protein